MEPIFRAPVFEPEAKRQPGLNFEGTVGAGAHLTLLAGPIPYGFRVLQVKMIFTDDANNWIRHYWFIDRSRATSVTAVPAGTNVFGRENPITYFIGKAIVRVVNANIEYGEDGLYIRCHTENTGPYAYNINCSITIQEL